MSLDEINEGPLIFVHLQLFAIPSAHGVSHLGSTLGGESNKQGSTERKKAAMPGLCSCISTIIVSSGMQTIHLHDTGTVRETSVPSIQSNEEKVMKMMVKIIMGKMSPVSR